MTKKAMIDEDVKQARNNFCDEVAPTIQLMHIPSDRMIQVNWRQLRTRHDEHMTLQKAIQVAAKLSQISGVKAHVSHDDFIVINYQVGQANSKAVDALKAKIARQIAWSLSE